MERRFIPSFFVQTFRQVFNGTEEMSFGWYTLSMLGEGGKEYAA